MVIDGPAQSAERYARPLRRFALAVAASLATHSGAPCIAQTGSQQPHGSVPSAIDAERAVLRICEYQTSIFSPEFHFIWEQCDMRTRVGTIEYWFSYRSETDTREPRCTTPKPWCAYPIRQLIVIVKDAAVPGREELLTDSGLRGVPDIGTVTFADRAEQQERYLRLIPARPDADEQPEEGAQYLDAWTCRYGQALAVALGRTPEPCAAITLVRTP